MAISDPTQPAHVARTPLAEALAARVEVASDAALAAYHAAADDRRRIHASEWDRPDRDTLWDIEEVADALHGYASWVTGGSRHPRPTAVQAALESFRGETLNLRLKLSKEHPGCDRLVEYIDRLDELRSALADYFQEERRPSSNQPDSGPSTPPAII